MRDRRRPRHLPPAAWGLDVGPGGDLFIGATSAAQLARRYGTPLHVVNEPRLEATARSFREAFAAAYPGTANVHYAFKCNTVPAVIEAVRRTGLRAEVVSPFELDLALRAGFRNREIIVNGPCKTGSFLRRCVEARVRLIVVDSLDELLHLEETCRDLDRTAEILLRVNPGYVPRGMNHGSATGSRKGCAFGLDLRGGEVHRALQAQRVLERVRFRGFHLHIGTGIRDPRDYHRALRCLEPLRTLASGAGFGIDILDVGGGFASPTSRELTSREMLVYQGLGKLPRGLGRGAPASFGDFASAITRGIRSAFRGADLPELLVEPGRCIASPNQMLLLTVHRIKTRPGIGTWWITDGGLGTVTMPTYYEYHEVFAAEAADRPRTERVDIVGPACFAGDIVYRNKPMPPVRPGQVLAVMDSGAYFTALESSFGYPRPAVAAVSTAGHRLVRRRETFEDMRARDEACTAPPLAQPQPVEEIVS